jgi:hypothetical protein
MYKRPDNSEAPNPVESKNTQGKVEDGRKWAGYNPAIEARWISSKDLDRVKSRTKASLKMTQGWNPYQGEGQARL